MHKHETIEFGYKSVCNQLITTHYVIAYKIIYVYFSHVTYLINHVTSLNNISDDLISCYIVGCNKLITNRFVAKTCLTWNEFTSKILITCMKALQQSQQSRMKKSITRDIYLVWVFWIDVGDVCWRSACILYLYFFW